MGLFIDPSAFLKGMSEAELKKTFAIEKYGETVANKLEAEAKKNRPWQDRTGNARNSIQGFSGWGEVSGATVLKESGTTKDGKQKYKSNGFNVSSQGGKVMTVGVAGNMEYSPYLEFCDEGKNAVLWPTVNGMAPEILAGLDRILEK